MGGTVDFPFEMTVIVPVYNAEGHLARCVASLDAQTLPQELFEVVLINDGSCDGSLALCGELASTRPNYVVINQENKGVSAARNAGIGVARGRYLMFLDSDDALSPSTIAALVSTFDAMADEVDLLFYDIEYQELGTGVVRHHKRARWMSTTGTYDLAEFPYLALSTVNSCVKNHGVHSTLFPVGMAMGEDQYFNTSVLAAKAKVGYCAEATYLHPENPESSSARGDFPEYAFEDMMRLYHMLLGLAEHEEHMAAYAYALVLYNIGWRFRGGKLFPDFGDDAQRRGNHERLAEVMRAIPYASWAQNPYLSDSLRIYLMNRYQVLGEVERVSYDKEGTIIHLRGASSLHLDPPLVTIDWALRHSSSVQIKGVVTGPAFSFEPTPSLVLEVAGMIQPLELVPSGRSDEGTGIPLTKAWRFEASLPSMGSRTYDACLHLSFDDRSVPMLSLRFDTVRCNGRMISPEIREYVDRRITLTPGRLHVGTVKDLPAWSMPFVTRMMRVRDRKRTGKYDYKLVASLRERLHRELPKRGGERVWLYVDGDAARAGGGAALKRMARDLELSDGITRLCVAADMAVEETQLSDVADHLVEHGSWEHVVNLLTAERIIVSKGALESLLPLTKPVWDRIVDFAREQTYVLLAGGDCDLVDSPFDCAEPES